MSIGSPACAPDLYAPGMGRGASFSSRLKRRFSTSRIMPKSSPGTRSAARMLNLRYWFFWNPSGPATIMAPTALLPWMWLLSYTSMRRGGRGRAKTSASNSNSLRWDELSASLRASASRALASA